MDGPRLISPTEDRDCLALSELLSREPVQNLFLLGALEDARRGKIIDASFYAVGDQQRAEAAVLVSARGLWVPVARDARLAQRLGEGLRNLPLLTTVGERRTVDALWHGYSGGRSNRPPRMARAQHLLEITPDDMGPWVTPHLRLAQEQDLKQIVAASAEMELADLGQDPRLIDAAAHEQRVLDRIRAGQTYVVFEGGRLLFKADVTTRSKFGALLEGVFTAPHCRGQGVATRALGQICRSMLSALPRLTLQADPNNRAATGLYRKLGFGQRAEFRLLIPG